MVIIILVLPVCVFVCTMSSTYFSRNGLCCVYVHI